MTRFEARDILNWCGAAIPGDYHRLRSDVVGALLAEADRLKYRQPRNANGSRARYFHDHLQRVAAREANR